MLPTELPSALLQALRLPDGYRNGVRARAEAVAVQPRRPRPSSLRLLVGALEVDETAVVSSAVAIRISRCVDCFDEIAVRVH